MTPQGCSATALNGTKGFELDWKTLRPSACLIHNDVAECNVLCFMLPVAPFTLKPLTDFVHDCRRCQLLRRIYACLWRNRFGDCGNDFVRNTRVDNH